MPNVKKPTGFKSFVSKLEGKEVKATVTPEFIDFSRVSIIRMNSLRALVQYLDDWFYDSGFPPYPEDCLVYLCINSRQYLHRSFIWTSTEHGHNYWASREDRISPINYSDYLYLSGLLQYAEGRQEQYAEESQEQEEF